MNINSVSTNNYNSNNFVKFTGRTRAEALMASVLAENGISAKSSKLVNKAWIAEAEQEMVSSPLATEEVSVEGK